MDKYEELIKQRNALSVEYKTKLEEAAKAWGQYAKDYRVNHPDATRADIYNDPEFKKAFSNLENNIEMLRESL